MAYVQIMHWSHNEPGQWRCAVSGATYQAHRLGDRRWMAEKIDPAGHYTALGLYDSLKDCKVYAGLDYVSEMRHKYPWSIQSRWHAQLLKLPQRRSRVMDGRSSRSILARQADQCQRRLESKRPGNHQAISPLRRAGILHMRCR